MLQPWAAVGRHLGVWSTSHLQSTFLAYLEGESDRPELSPTASLQGTHRLEGRRSPKLPGIWTVRNGPADLGGSLVE